MGARLRRPARGFWGHLLGVVPGPGRPLRSSSPWRGGSKYCSTAWARPPAMTCSADGAVGDTALEGVGDLRERLNQRARHLARRSEPARDTRAEQQQVAVVRRGGAEGRAAEFGVVGHPETGDAPTPGCSWRLSTSFWTQQMNWRFCAANGRAASYPVTHHVVGRAAGVEVDPQEKVRLGVVGTDVAGGHVVVVSLNGQDAVGDVAGSGASPRAGCRSTTPPR